MKVLFITPNFWERTVNKTKEKVLFLYKNKQNSVSIDVQVVDDPFTIANLAIESIKSNNYERVIVFSRRGLIIPQIIVKTADILAARINDEHSAYMTVLHNNTKIVIISLQHLGTTIINRIIFIFLTTSYEGGRHKARLDMLSKLTPDGGE